MDYLIAKAKYSIIMAAITIFVAGVDEASERITYAFECSTFLASDFFGGVIILVVASIITGLLIKFFVYACENW